MALIDTYKAVKHFVSVGISEKHAEAITDVISSIDHNIATKADIARLGSDIAILESKISKLESKLDSDILRLEDKIETESKWVKTMFVIIIGFLIKITFFNV